jgi:PKHD-type hydroxylase
MTVQLSPPDDYAGGNLEFVGNRHPSGRELGDDLSGLCGHRVTPVERGTRRSPVAWVYGPSFR